MLCNFLASSLLSVTRFCPCRASVVNRNCIHSSGPDLLVYGAAFSCAHFEECGDASVLDCSRHLPSFYIFSFNFCSSPRTSSSFYARYRSVPPITGMVVLLSAPLSSVPRVHLTCQWCPTRGLFQMSHHACTAAAAMGLS
ncbi:hypothetical protein JB92DRAFT_1383524 [Gautieria morchelliformis]|nr:hypothetical protein JB92DRAFT_1383524 [Gautieria morchelliformis]